MEIEMLRAQLEELFELEELKALCHQLLGFEPGEVGGTKAVGSFARALSSYCAEHEAVQALAEAVMVHKPAARGTFQDLACRGLETSRLRVGDPFGGFNIKQELGRGPTGTSYEAERAGVRYRLKVLDPNVGHELRGLQRFLALSRWAGQQQGPAIAPGLEVGREQDRVFLVQRFVPGVSLTEYVKSGPLALEEFHSLARQLLVILKLFHARGLAHGNLKPENIIINPNAEGGPQLQVQDAAADRLNARTPANGHLEVVNLNAPTVTAPEVIRGHVVSPTSDIYSVGALCYLMLAGQLPFSSDNAMDLAIAHLTTDPPPLGSRAPAGRVDEEVQALIEQLLSKLADVRPPDAKAGLEMLERVMTRKSQRPPMPESMVDALIQALLDAPGDSDAAVALEAAVDNGAPAARAAQAFAAAVDAIPKDDPDLQGARLNLAFRAGRLFRSAKDPQQAEQIYTLIVKLDPKNPVAFTALQDLRKELGKHEELVESWLANIEDEGSSTRERAEMWMKIGDLYESELADPGQAVIAFTQAFCETLDETAARSIERLAGDDESLWSEVLDTCREAASGEMATEDKNRLLTQMGDWHAERLNRSDLALQDYDAVLAGEPGNESALEGLARIYRKAQQWSELAEVLLHRVQIAATPAEGRDIHLEAAQLYATKLNDPIRARELLELILSQDPAHGEANETLGKLYRDAGDYQAFAKLLERAAEAAEPGERMSLLVRAGGTYEAHLASPSEAMTLYQTVVSEDPTNMDALRGLDRLYGVLGQYDDLLANLQDQLQAAATPRQKLELHRRIAALYEEEFLSPSQAAEAYQDMLEIDPQHEDAMAGLVRAYQRLENWEELAQVYERHARVVTDDERKATLLLESARLYVNQLDSPERAMKSFEAVVALDPHHKEALEGLAVLTQTLGDADEALRALDALAEGAETPEGKVEQLLRAAILLRDRDDWDGAAKRYNAALALTPQDAKISSALREVYLAKGALDAVRDSLQRELETASTDGLKLRLNAELARLAFRKLKDKELAEQAAGAALSLDPTCADALSVLGDLAFEDGRLVEAAVHYGKLQSRMTSNSDEHLLENLKRYVVCLVKNGDTDRAMDQIQTLVDLAPDDHETLLYVADLTFEHGDPEDSERLYTHLIEEFSSMLSAVDIAVVHYRRAESVRRQGDLTRAISLFEDAMDLDPSSADPLLALAKCYEAQQNWDKVWALKGQLLELPDLEDRAGLLVEMAELASTRLNDRARATASYVAALKERPDDRKLLTRLMQLYSEDKDWAKLVDVVVKLADFQEDPAQKAKYLMTAGMVNARELDDYDKALAYFAQVRELDPSVEKAMTESVAIHRERGEYEDAERLLKRRAKLASKQQDTQMLLRLFGELADIYSDTGRTGDLVDALEAANTLAPDNQALLEKLGELYRQNAGTYFNKAVALQTKLLRADPYRADAYKALRKLYTGTKQADGAWCLCQALYVLNMAEPDEERFFSRMRSDEPAYAREVVSEELWAKLVHPDVDLLLTHVFALIEPAVVSADALGLEHYGYLPHYRVDLERHQYPIGQTLHYAAGVLDIQPPACFENANDAGGLMYLHTSPPALSMGLAVLDTQLSAQSLAFLAGRHLASYRPGFYVRQLVPSSKGLKGWLFAAVKLVSPQFPVSSDIQEEVSEALAALNQYLPLERHEELSALVAQLLQQGASVDLKRWIAGVDLSIDRAGFLLAHDLETALENVRASKNPLVTATPRRVKELVLFSISPAYLALRKRLGITVG